MQCPKCGKTGFVTLSGKRYCSNCGAKLDAAAMPTATMSDIKMTGKTLDLRSSTPDVTKTAAAVTAAAAGKPAGQFHGQAPSGGGVLDLRTLTTPTPPVTAPAPTPTQTPAPTPASAAPVPQTITPAPKPQPIAAAKPDTAPAAATAPTPVVTPKPALPAPKPAASQPIAPAVPLAAPNSSVPQSPLINKYPAHPAVAQPNAAVLPEAVATQVDTMQGHVAPPPPQPQSPALRQALKAAKQSSTTPTVLKIGAALVAIGVMSSVVWMQNSPKLAFRNAAAQAGIAASLPTYIPSSYHQTGPANVSPGALSLSFSSPSVSQPLKIIQQRSDWDANALRENYVSTQTASFLAIQGQGLTIYLGGDQANWINHGVWYQLSGVSKLSREDVLKIAYGL